MDVLTFTITEDGTLLVIDGAAAREFAAGLGEDTVSRASHVIPVNLLLRGLFILIRASVPDTSAIAEWTRGWRVRWLVDASPVGGVVLPGRWTNRQQAIDAEVEYLNQHFLA